MSESTPKPEVQLIRTRARRIVNTGRYESYELQTEVEAAPDPDRKVSENVAFLQRFVTKQVDDLADEVAARHTNND